MKTIKKIAAMAMVAAVAVTAGWNFYQNTQGVEMNELALANVEALANGGESGGGTITGNCTSSVVIVTECRVQCGCGRVWYPSPRIYNANASNVSGCCTCGICSWNNYN